MSRYTLMCARMFVRYVRIASTCASCRIRPNYGILTFCVQIFNLYLTRSFFLLLVLLIAFNKIIIASLSHVGSLVYQTRAATRSTFITCKCSRHFVRLVFSRETQVDILAMPCSKRVWPRILNTKYFIHVEVTVLVRVVRCPLSQRILYLSQIIFVLQWTSFVIYFHIRLYPCSSALLEKFLKSNNGFDVFLHNQVLKLVTKVAHVPTPLYLNREILVLR